MLLRFQVTNFRSFRAQQTLSMVAGPFKDHAEAVFHPSGVEEGVLPVAAMYGANASGKTNVILALRFMRDAVKNSHARWEPDTAIELEPFASEPASPTTFAADFLLNGVRYQYGISMSPAAVLEEWVFAYPSGKKQTWFAREKDKPISFSAKMPGDNRMIERLTRPNSLFLSAAAQNNHEALSPIFRWFSQSLAFVVDYRSGMDPRGPVLCRDAGSKSKLARLLSMADLGIADLRVEDAAIPDDDRRALALLRSRLEDVSKTDPKVRIGPEVEQVLDPKEVLFLHQVGDSMLSFHEAQESKGTIAFLSLLAQVLRTLNSSGLLCIDELDHSLHPLLAIEVIRLFNDPKRNPNGAQLIFNTHDTNLLSADLLRRDQIWFTEKGRDGASQLYPLTDFKPRREENLETGYLQGRYGAIPFLNPDSFLGHEEE